MNDIFSTREAAQYVKLGQSTLERYRVTGGGPRYAKLADAGAVRYRKCDLDDWIESRLISSTSDQAA